MRFRRLLIACVCVAICVSCGGETDSGPTPVESTPVVAPKVEGPVVVGTPVWTLNTTNDRNEPGAQVNSFPDTATQIVVAFPVENVPKGTEFKAQWLYNNTTLDAFTTDVIASTGVQSSWAEFRLTRDSGDSWPDGEYTVVLVADGEEVARSSVQVTRT